MVTSDETGLCLKSSSKVGIKGIASLNSASKNCFICSSVLRLANDFSPSNGRNKVQVKFPSGLGSAIIIKLPRGQICSAFFSIKNEPSLPGGMINSLYPQSI